MSGSTSVSAVSVVAAPRRRSRSRLRVSGVDVARGAPAEELDRPAGDFLADVRWEGPPPDPGELDAATFLAQL